ncbi:hypothetical protein ONZ43_g6032 [Nemania bipapillata]|uniref:Uncharacterized protein n=1 Tax=Nemania bipapillata TaxID=110536 RepID=A0ACC2I3E8_9PEZI|nr:hypothetical protein ONZ43_g6032 [Nemania bipapillata]
MLADDEIPRYCAQLFLPAELAERAVEVALKENPENIINSPDMTVPPAGGAAPAQGSGPPRMGLFVRKMWKPGRTLRVRFLSGGSALVRSKVKQYAAVWSEYANINFQFVDSGDADIRITFASGGSWSYIGTDCKDTTLVPAGQATMNFGWFHDKSQESDFSGTIMHEFGHAIGCVHEHSQPNADIQWNKPVVLAAYARQGWTAEMVESNIFFQYNRFDVTATNFDSLSIMEYPIPKGFTTDGFVVGYNDRLSSDDIAFARRMYPKQTPIEPQPGRKGIQNVEIGVFNTIAVTSPGAAVKNHRTIVGFAKEYSTSPAFTVGLNFLDFDKSHNLRIRSKVDTVLPSQAMLNLQSWGDTVQNASGVSWFLYPSDDNDIQGGSFTTKNAGADTTITFRHEYSSIPRVVVFLTALDVDKSTNCCVKAYASNVTTRGFKLHIETWSNSKLSECGASWVAHPVDKPGIFSGSFSTQDATSCTTAQVNKKGTLLFTPSFDKPPKMFLALNMLDIDRGNDTRVRLSGSSISGQQMEWHIDSWGNATVNAAGAAYIAINS